MSGPCQENEKPPPGDSCKHGVKRHLITVDGESSGVDERVEDKSGEGFKHNHEAASHVDHTLDDSQVVINSPTLFDLPWEQVLCCHILQPYLSLSDLFRFRAVSRQCLQLVQVNFSMSHVVNTSPFQNNFSSQAFEVMIRDCEYLRILSVRGAKSWMTNDLLLKVIHTNPKLEKIDLTGCTSLSGNSMYSIGVWCHNLKHLSLRGCVWLTPDNFSSFLHNKRDIEFLDLSSCWNITDDLIVSLAMSCLSLKHLMLSNIYGLSDCAINAVAHNCPNLVLLNIQGCWRISNQPILLLSQYCPKLKFLQIKECHAITEDSLKPLRDKGIKIDRLRPPNTRLVRVGLPNINLQI